jgi:hypothetical protein
MGIWDDLTGQSSAEASNAAAADQFRKQQNAGKDLRKFGDTFADRFDSLSQMFSPYAGAGGDALKMYRAGLGLDGGAGSQAFTQAYQGLPGYQSGLKTGTDAAMAAANSSDMLQSGKTLKALQRYGSDYENQRSGSFLDRLMGLSGMGQQATGQQVSTAGQGLQGQLNSRTSAYGGDMTAAGTIGQGMVAAEQARQQGTNNLMGAASFLGGTALTAGLGGTGMGGIGGAAGGLGTKLSGLFSGGGSGYSAASPYTAAPGNYGQFSWGGQNYPMAR